MMTEILLKQAMVGIVGSIGSAIGGAASGGHPRQAVQPFRPLRRNSILRPGDLREPAANMSQRGLFTVVNLSSRRRQPAGLCVGNLYRLMRGYAEGGYVGAGSPAQMRRAEGINFNQNNHVVIQNDGTNGLRVHR